jgi:hypothetical protein
MEKFITLDYDYSSPETFWEDVKYMITQREGEDVEYDILDIFELEEDEECEQEECIIVYYKIYK